MNMSAELHVLGVVPGEPNEVVIVGVPNNHVTIKVGDVFTTRYSLSKKDILEDVPHPPRSDEKDVCLRVKRIELLRQDVRELDHGMTGTLYLSGDGFDAVTPKCFLRT